MNNAMTEKEVEYIKLGMVSPNLKEQKSLDAISWWVELTRDVLMGKANQEEILQYNRVNEIENLLTLLAGNIPKSMSEYLEIVDVLGDHELEFILRMMVENDTYEMENQFNLKDLREIFTKEYGQDLDEPFIKELINELQTEYVEQQKYERKYANIQNANFEYLSDEIIYGFLLLLFSELRNKTGNRKTIKIMQLDEKEILYLIFKYSQKFSSTLGNNNSNKKK